MKSHTRYLALALCIAAACAQTNNHSQAKDGAAATDSAASASDASAKTAMRAESDRYKQAGFAVYEDDGRLWVFRSGSEELKSFHEKGEPAKRVTLIGAGPDGKTVLGAEKEVLEAYCATRLYGVPGYAVIPDDGRLWIFRENSEAHKEFLAKGEPAKRVTLIGAGPDGMTLLGDDVEVIKAYRVVALFGMPGYAVIEDDGRLWVFRENSEAHKEFLAKGEPAKRVTLIGAGPEGMTVLGAEKEVLDAYCAPFRYGVPGYVVIPDDGRLWIFRKGSEAHAMFVAKGEPAKRVTLIGAGPDGLTLLGDDVSVLKAYRVAVLYGKPGFAVIEDDGRLWIFRENGDDHREYLEKGEPAKRVTLIGAGPNGMTLMGADRETLVAYMGGSNP